MLRSVKTNSNKKIQDPPGKISPLYRVQGLVFKVEWKFSVVVASVVLLVVAAAVVVLCLLSEMVVSQNRGTPI